jgi:hypothetical protein
MIERLWPLFVMLSALCVILVVFNLICTKWGKRIAWAIIILCLSYLSVKP